MDKKVKKYVKIGIVIVIIGLFIWFLVLSPYLTFKKNENTMKEAAKRYIEINAQEAPTGNRVKTITLQTLYHKAYIKEDFYVPYTSKACSLKESWVKVKRVNGEYQYYPYLKCGVLESTVDHKGPVITLNGDDAIIVNKSEKYQELGIKSVVDNTDGKMSNSSVTIKSNVNTEEVGNYEVTYSVTDSFNNKTTKIRKVTVVERLKNAVNQATKNQGYYMGSNPNNYIYFSGMLFRIVGLDGDNVKIIADTDIANVNYAGIEKWLDYYYDHLTDKAKKMIVKNKYCNMSVAENTTDTTECNSYTNGKNTYIISIDEINRATANDGNFLKPQSMSWTANKKDDNNAYVTRNRFFGTEINKNYLAEDQTDNYGVRPVLTIKGDNLIQSGTGTKEDPYSLGEFTYAKANDLLNTRFAGEYISYSGYLWRIVDVDDDGTVKVISDDTIKKDGQNIETYYDTSAKAKIYNPNQKGNVGYYIKNSATEFVDTSYFVSKNVTVPIYKEKILYGKETDTKKYKVKLSAPNMYEMFSAFVYEGDSMQSYWFINSSKKQYIKATISDIGVVLPQEVYDNMEFGIRVVGYLNKNVAVSKGKGTKQNPYTI